jgi:DNA-binding MarR family transcriptional regulator
MTSPPPSGPTGRDTATALNLGRLIGRLRRAVNRSVRTQGAHLPIRESHIEILRVVNESPCRIQDVADKLHLAHNTVSTATQQLVGQGLLERLNDDSDGRVVRLRLTARAEQHIDQWRKHRAQILSQEIDLLSVDEQETLAQALPVLDKVARGLEANA